MKIFFFIESLGFGGAQVVTSLVADKLVEFGHDVSIVTDIYTHSAIKIPSRIHVIPLFTKKKESKKMGTIIAMKNIRKYVSEYQPDVSIAIMPSMFRLLLYATIGLKNKIIASDHTSFERELGFRNKIIRFYLYRFADAVTVLSRADYNFLGNRLPNKVIMPNPLSYECISTLKIKRNKRILAAGRLDVWYIKGFDILIKAWGSIAKRHPEWTLEIAGDGSDESKTKLQNLIDENMVNNQTSLIGFQEHLDSCMRNSEIFVLSSRVEGFGMVLIEAMSQGCTCISFDCGGRQSEIINNYKNGIVISEFDSEKLARSINELIENEELRYKLASCAISSAKRYSVDQIARKWETLFNNI